MTFSFHPDAEVKFNEAIDYYEVCRENLGLEFAKEIYDTIQRVLLYPTAWQILDESNRRCLVNRFPFGIIYYQKEGEIVILAVMELHKQPNYWKDRSE